MKPAPKIRLDSLKSTSTAKMDSLQEANGAGQAAGSVAKLVKGKATDIAPKHQTHGAGVPTGPISSVSQLIGRSMARGSISSYDTLADYSAFLNTLSLGELHRHAVEEAKIVPIDDRNRLIRRLEGEWGAFASKVPGNPRVQAMKPNSTRYTQKQLETNAELMRKCLGQQR